MKREYGIFVGTEEGGDSSDLFAQLYQMGLIDIFGTTACHPVSTFISAHYKGNFVIYGATLRGCAATALVRVVTEARGIATVDFRHTRMGPDDIGFGSALIWEQRKRDLEKGIHRELGRKMTIMELGRIKLLPNG